MLPVDKTDRFTLADVIKYFRENIDGGELSDFWSSERVYGGNVTAENVDLETIADRFMETRMPDFPLSPEEYFDTLLKDVLPYTINTASPAFIGHMTSGLPYYVHDISKLISQLNQNLVKIETSKSLTFLEREAIAMLHRSFYAFPDDFYDTYSQKLGFNLGIVTSGGSTANLSAILSARNRALSNVQGIAGNVQQDSIYSMLRKGGFKDMVLIGSGLMHYSFRKAAAVLGLGQKNILYVKNDENGAMCPDDLEEKINACRREDLLIIAIIGIAGSTETGSIDPLLRIRETAQRHNIYFHVDAAWGGALIFSDHYKHLIAGIGEADSITFCGHKQLFLPQGISVCLFKDPAQINYNSTTANYQAKGNSFDTGRVTIEGSRPALSICLHASLRVMGKRGYELLIDSSIQRAGVFARMIRQSDVFELIGCAINIVNYRYIPAGLREEWKSGLLTGEMNDRISRINSEIQQDQFLKGKTFVSKTTIGKAGYGEIVVFRCVLANPLTTTEDLISVLNDQFEIIERLFGEANALLLHHLF